MNSEQNDIGIIGLGVMGCSLALNIADHGFSPAGYDINRSQIDECNKASEGKVFATDDLDEFVASLKPPRAIIVLVPAGKPVDAALDQLALRLAPGDIVIDGGNSHFTDTDERIARMSTRGIDLIGMGISGGQYGARHGPSLMPGGSWLAYDRIAPILEAVAARANAAPCVTYLGPGSCGHYVKMVHNGIEYGLMRLIAETYDIMKRGLGFDNDRLIEIYAAWNSGPLSGYLIEITSSIFKTVDDRTGSSLIDVILDEAQQKGTGAWTSESAMELQVPVPNIDAGVEMRDLSCYRAIRQYESCLLAGPPLEFPGDAGRLLDDLSAALHLSMLLTYIQGFSLLWRASKEYKYSLHLNNVAQVWRAGCIIRSAILEDLYSILTENDRIEHLLDEPAVAAMAVRNHDALRKVVAAFAQTGIPAPGFMAALSYYDSFRSAWSPANLIQAQRDFFGAHTYQRTDAEGTFHTDWLSAEVHK